MTGDSDRDRDRDRDRLNLNFLFILISIISKHSPYVKLIRYNLLGDFMPEDLPTYLQLILFSNLFLIINVFI